MHLHVYCDESRQTKDRFMVLGGICIADKAVPKFNATMAQFRQEQRMFAELKWTKVSTAKLKEYKRFVDYFFALNNTDEAHFHALFLDTHQIDHKRFNNGNREVGFYKFYYQFLLHDFGKRYCKENDQIKISVFLDYRSSNYKLSDLRTILNNGVRKKFSIQSSPFHSVEPRDSKKSELIQIADILMGAIGFQLNGYDLLAGAKEAKKELASYIAQKAGLLDLKRNTKFGVNRFTLWNFQLQKKSAPQT